MTIDTKKLKEAEAENAALKADKERLDSGRYIGVYYDEFGDRHECEHVGCDLRAMIDKAIALHAKDLAMEDQL